MSKILTDKFGRDQKKEFLYFLLILLFHLLFVVFIAVGIYPIHFTPHNFFFLELIGGISFYFPLPILLLFEIGNIFLFWLIGKLLFPKFSLVPVFIYSIAPWGVYSLIFGSFYTYLLFLVLLFFYGFLLLDSGKKFLGGLLIVIPLAGFIYSSVFGLFLLIAFGILLAIKEYSFKSLKIPLVVLAVLLAPYIFLVLSNTTGFINVFKNETKVFSDPGIINTVNEYQTSPTKSSIQKIARISENKYIFFSEYVTIKFIKQLIPSTIFTSEGKLGYFSFNSPIFLGFLIPFIYGLALLFTQKRLRNILILSTVLALPSTLALQMVDLNRLLIFVPVIVALISLGLINLWTNHRKKVHKVFLILCFSLVIFQFLIVLYDIPMREKERFNRYFYFEKNFEISKQ